MADIGSSNRVSLRYIKETTWGTLPTTPTLQAWRHTDESITHNIGNVGSNEIRSDRATADSIQTDKNSGGGFNFELSPSSFDDMFVAALCDTDWADITSTSWASGAISLGDLCVPTTPNGYYYECTTAGTGSTEPTWTTDYGDTFVDGTVTWTCRGPVSAIQTGTTKNSYSIEKALLDIDEYFLYTGMIVNRMDITVTANSQITGSLDFLGKIPTGALAQTTNASSVTAVTTTEVFNAISNVGTLYENGSALSGVYLQEVSFSINNNLRALPAISYDSAIDVALGTCEITGTINAYFADDSLYDKFIAGTATSLVVPISNSEGELLFYFPRIKFEADETVGGGLNTDVMERITFRALYDSTETFQFQVQVYNVP